MNKACQKWIPCIKLFVLSVIIYGLSCWISNFLCKDEVTAIFLKSYLYETIIIILAVYVLRKNSFRVIKGEKAINFGMILCGFGLLIVCQVLSSIILPGSDNNLENTLHNNVLVAAPTIILLGPIAEELFFRGALYNWLKVSNEGKVFLSAIISSLMFSIMHFDLQGCIYNFFSGCIYAMIYEKTGSLWNSIVCHILMNLIVFSIQISL